LINLILKIKYKFGLILNLKKIKSKPEGQAPEEGPGSVRVWWSSRGRWSLWPPTASRRHCCSSTGATTVGFQLGAAIEKKRFLIKMLKTKKNVDFLIKPQLRAGIRGRS
jgi:hypothetical protein